MNITQKQVLSVAFIALIGVLLWFFFRPEGISEEGAHFFSIFAATIVGIVLRPFPMGVIAVLSLTVCLVTKMLTFAEAFSGFQNEIVWLVVFAFFISRGFIVTGLGNRMAYCVMSYLGKSSLGLGYGLVATDYLLSPVIPSITARSGGIVYPIFRALADIFTGDSYDPKMGSFLAMSAFQGTVISSAMFLTAMAGNPLVVELAGSQGVEITWRLWAVAAFVPGICSLIVVPYALYRTVSPTIKKTPHARELAIKKLKEMGSISSSEWIVLTVFLLLIFLWILGPTIHLKATVAAMIGLAALLLTGILRWKDVLEEHVAWDTFIWFATLITLATYLNRSGFTVWFSQLIVGHVTGLNWEVGFTIIALIYFYSHYLFASNVAHIGAMYTPFLLVAVALGTPIIPAALLLGFLSSLFGGLTQYGCGPAPIYFGSGFLTIKEWWKLGAVAGICNFVIWLVIGGLWWKVLGLW